MLEIPAIAISAEGYHPDYDLTVPARVARLLVDRSQMWFSGQDSAERQLSRPFVGGPEGAAPDHFG